MNKLYITILKLLFFMPLIPAVALGLEKGLNWKGYLMVYVVCFFVLLLASFLFLVLGYLFNK
jgi:hypothetical protein